MSFLTRIELHGFKSFSEKTTLTFPAPITGVVGPNGSGKSNIVDALRWVLGERGGKSLRSGTSDNLIFAGTPKRGAASLARVSLHFNNHSRLFPLEAEEVVIERKIDKSGNSQCFINSAETRLRDLYPILARAKLGTRGLTIIGQGQSDLFVRSTPKERRTMIEEILGLKEFRIKKEDAERRLKSSESNTEKVTAMMKELKPHLTFLQKQKTRWDARAGIEKELHTLETDYFTTELAQIKAELEKIGTPKEDAETEKHEKEIAKLEEELKTFEAEQYDTHKLTEIKRERDTLLQEKSRIEREITKIETQHEIQQAQEKEVPISTKDLHETTQKFHKELAYILSLNTLESIKEKLTHWRNIFDTLFTNKKDDANDKESEEVYTKKIEALQKSLSEIEEKIKTQTHAEEKIVQGQQDINKAFRKKVEEIEALKNNARAAERKIESQRFARQKYELKLEELETKWQSLGHPKEALYSLSKQSEPAPRPLADAMGSKGSPHETERKIFRLRGELAAIGEIDTEALKEADETEKRYAFLEKELHDLDKARGDLGDLVKDLERKIHQEFRNSFRKINEAFNTYFATMFGGGRARLRLVKPLGITAHEESDASDDGEEQSGIEIELTIPRKKIKGLDMLSGGERCLVSLAALFALISISAPPFLVLDEMDAALDDDNARRFSELLRTFSKKTQFLIITHNHITMETTDILYGITMADDGVSKVLSLKLEEKA